MIGIKSICKLYKDNSVSICGKKGRGKDMLTANIIARSGKPYYISNIDYKLKNSSYIPFDIKLLKSGNTYENFIEGNTKQYIYPYPQDIDLFLSDCGVYFPSQYNGELNRKYKDLPVFMALSRQLGNCFVHTNSQALSRVWDKIREQSDTYILCNWCKVFKNLVVQKVTIYEKFDSCNSSVPVFPLRRPLLNAEGIRNWNIEKSRYDIQYGSVKSKILIYFNKSNYDTRYFKTLLEGNISES